MAELHRRRLASVLTADSHFQFGARLAALLDSNAHQFSHALAINHLEWILFEDALAQVRGQNLVDVITREAEGGLREIVGAETEELGFLGDLVSNQSRARQLNHGSYEIVDFLLFLFEDLFRNSADDASLEIGRAHV